MSTLTLKWKVGNGREVKRKNIDENNEAVQKLPTTLDVVTLEIILSVI